MLAKFHGKVDYSDAPTGFFGFLRETFEKLAREEQLAAQWEGVEAPDYPSFGHKDDTYEDVVRQFYAAWNSFSTRKSFAWRDRYRYSDATDRRMRRLMEKENKSFREEGIREFNDAIRTLVAFVRKRDPRYTPNIQTDEERQKIMRDAAKAQAARQRAANAAKLSEDVPEWTKSRDPEELEESEDDEEEQEEFECVACRKTFKSERQFDAHEKSKKHQKAVQTLKKKMYKDNKNLNLDEDAPSSGMGTPSGEEEEARELDEGEEEAAEAVEGLDLNDEHGDDTSADGDHDRDAHEGPEGSNPEGHPTANGQAAMPTDEDSKDEDSDYAPRSEVEERLANSLSPEATPALDKKLGKAAQKRAKKAAQKAAVEQDDLRFKCAKCNAAFPSRTRLFQHLSDLGHAAPVPKGKKKK
jgi:DnaJ family protein A protein 5